MRLKTRVIVNPASNRGRTRRRWSEIRDGLRHFVKDFKCDFTEKPLQATELARDAIKDGTELLIGVGGDGTMNEIANGFYEDRRLINPAATLGVVPSGTGCDLTRSLNIPPGLKNALRVITEAPSCPIDVGQVTYASPEGPRERYFLNVADFGLGGEVVKRVNDQRLRRKASSYVRCLVSTMARYRSKRLRLWVDGRELPEDDYLVGAVANGRVFGKGMKVAPDARVDDGLFDVVLVKGLRFLEFCRYGWRLINGSHVKIRHKVTIVRGRRVEARPAGGPEGAGDVLLEFDGEQDGRLPASFEIVERALPVKGFL